MKKLVVWLIVVGMNLPLIASAGEVVLSSDHPTQLKLYFRLQMGSVGRKTSTPTFGLSLDRELAPPIVSDGQWTSTRSASLLDLQFTRLGAQGLRIGGTNVASHGNDDTVWTSPWLWVGVGAGLLLVSCVSDHFPCSGGSNHMGGGGGGGGY